MNEPTEEYKRHYAWVARVTEEYVRKYDCEGTDADRALVEARIRNLIMTYAPAPEQMTPREVELRAEVARLREASLKFAAEIVVMYRSTVWGIYQERSFEQACLELNAALAAGEGGK